MFAIRMIQLIEAHASKLSEELMHRLESSDRCRELLRRMPGQELKMRTDEIYRNLSDWLLEKTQTEIEELYIGIGMRRAKQGVPFSELLLAFTATKDCLWEYLEQDGLLEEPVELIGDLNLLRSVGRFFDRIAYAAAIGSEGSRRKKDQESLPCLSPDVKSRDRKAA
jgi:hypothetical protein